MDVYLVFDGVEVNEAESEQFKQLVIFVRNNFWDEVLIMITIM